MRVIISAGGTGGHIYPALAIINKIKEKEPKSEFLYIGTHNRMEKDIIPKYDIPFETIEIYGFNRKKLYKNIKAVTTFFKSYQKCKKLIKNFKPDIVIGVGGYVTGPVIYAAHKLGYPTFIHEQNSVPGKCNSFLAKYVTLIGTSFKSTIDKFPGEKTIFTGNPCSEDAVKKTPMKKSELGLSEQKKLVLIVMGSLGSSKINDYFANIFSTFNGKNYQVLYVTGNASYESLKNRKVPTNVKLVPYIENMTRIMKNTDLMVTRAGASTLSEIIALKVPSIIIPSPYVPDNHQYKNAIDLVKNNAAVMIEEHQLKGDILVRKIDSLIKDDTKMEEMRKNLSHFGVTESATIIYDNIKKIIGEK